MQPWQPLEIPAGRDGISRAKNPTLVRPSHLAYAESITTERAMFEKMPGASKANSTVLAGDVLALYEFYAGDPHFEKNVVCYVDNGVTATTQTFDENLAPYSAGATPLTTGGFPWFVEAWDGTVRFLLLYNGLDQVQLQYGGGTDHTNHPNPSPDWTAGNYPTSGCGTRLRSCAWGNQNFPHTIYLTQSGSHGTFVGGDSATEIVFPGVGDRIVGGLFHNEKVYVGKYPRGICYLDESDPDPANWSRGLVTSAIGMAGPGCILDVGDDVIILSTDGYFYALSRAEGAEAAEQVPPFMAMETSEFIREKLNLNYLSKTRSIWYGHKRQAWFSVPTGNSTTCDGIIIFDLSEDGNPKLLFSSRDEALGLGLVRETPTSIPKPAFGGTDRLLWLADRAARTKDGQAYNCQYETVPVAMMPGGIQRANLEELQVVMQPQGNWDLTLQVLRDNVLSQTLAFSMQTPGTGVGSLSLDSDVIAGQTIANVRERLSGDCRYVKLIGGNDNANENFAVSSHVIRWMPGNERP